MYKKICTTTFLFLSLATLTSSASDSLWSYEGETGPTFWGSLNQEYILCEKGEAQSPIDLVPNIALDIEDLNILYHKNILRLINTGHSLQLNLDNGSALQVGHQQFTLLKLSFHMPSEHTLAGRNYPMELHFLHRNQSGEYGTIAVFVEEGEANATVETILDRAPAIVGQEIVAKKTLINLKDLFPSDRSYIRYMGSSTTPPCAEGMHWHVLKDPITFSSKQIARFKEFYPNNARPIQKLHQRSVIEDTHHEN